MRKVGRARNSDIRGNKYNRQGRSEKMNEEVIKSHVKECRGAIIKQDME